MSHFPVGVITNDLGKVERMLAPYNENNRHGKAVRLSREEVIQDARRIADRYKGMDDNHLFQHFSGMANDTAYVAADGTPLYTEFRDDIRKLATENPDEDALIQFYEKHENIKDGYMSGHGELLYDTNPEAKWDWWKIGGRYDGMIRERVNGTIKASSCAKIKDIVFEPDPERVKGYARFWEVAVEGQPLQPGENADDFYLFYKKEYMLSRYRDKETYASINAGLYLYAILDDDGWHSKGNMGWFGMSSESGEESLAWDLNLYKNFLKDRNPEDYLVVVDCHI